MASILYVVLPCCNYRLFQYDIPLAEGDKIHIECPHGTLYIKADWIPTKKEQH